MDPRPKLDPRDQLVNDNEFRVLALDGGGIRGAMVAGYLARVEKKLSRPIAAGADLIVGTSTGSIVAALLGLGLSAEVIRDFYAKQGRYVFEPPVKQQGKWLGAALVFGALAVLCRLIRDLSLSLWPRLSLPRGLTDWLNWLNGQNGEHLDQVKGVIGLWLFGLFLGASLLFILIQVFVWLRAPGTPLYWLLFAKYGLADLDKQMLKALTDNAAELKLRPGVKRDHPADILVDDASRRLLITAYDLTCDEALVIKTAHLGTSPQPPWKVLHAVRCSTAAPFFFPPKRIEAAEMGREKPEEFGMNCDGGVWANNPALVGYVEARKILRALGRPELPVKILSVGTGLPGRMGYKKPLIGYGIIWAFGRFLGALWNGQSANVGYMLSKLIDFPLYVRVNFAIPAQLSAMDDPRNIGGLLKAAEDLAELENAPGQDALDASVAWFA